MNFKKFPESTHMMPTQNIVEGKLVHETLHFHASNNMIVMCAHVNNDDLKRIAKSGCVWIIAGPGFQVPPPMSVQAKHPFEPDPDKKPSSIMDVTGKPFTSTLNPATDGKSKTENQNPPSAGDDKQPHKGDSELPQ